ncbi:uncharacterized protein K441DRAFT_697930 [Cenococcum geophilum 1.58]|uniref:uncharacterized protein n=1 Tax=Cenococcum geophilum 1.58 TaxID=794803 RepID=UPI00358FFC34|nr:hypothetical protein K441DRAFT_697930 [Cenococcum geophilum 1.58]
MGITFSRREVDLESASSGRYKSRRTLDDIPRLSEKRRKRRGGSRAPFNFSRMLAAASMNPDKHAPLYTERYGSPTIRIRALQHMTIIHLRRVLAGEVAEIIETETADAEQMERIRGTLNHYVTALRDMKYMLEPASQNKRTARFLRDLLYINDPNDSAIMVDAGIMPRDSVREDPRLGVPDYTGDGGYSSRNDTAQEYSREFFSRLKMALFGGSALIAPMLIMRLHATLLTELLTTSLFVVVVGLILAWYIKDADKKDILGATATYAAVLVVFIGTSG